MIQDLVAFIEGRLYVERETAKQVYLNNGNHYNAHRFHQARTVLSQFFLFQMQTSEDVQAMTKHLEERRLTALTLMKKKADELDRVIHGFTIADIIDKCTANMPFGKYCNRKVKDIFKEDRQYFEWFFSNTRIDFNTWFEIPERTYKTPQERKDEQDRYAQTMQALHERALEREENTTVIDEPIKDDLPF